MKNIVPPIYDTIAENDLTFAWPGNNKFIILRKDGVYGVTALRYDPAGTTWKMSNTIEPVFSALPGFYFKDCYGQNEEFIFGVYDDAFRFLSYVNAKGFLDSRGL